MSGQLSLLAEQQPTADTRDCWRTPRELWGALSARWPFCCDVACDDDNCLVPVGFRLRDALVDEWPSGTYGWCFCNPPFSRLPEFSSRICGMVDRGSRVVALYPGHRHEQEWWHKFVLGRAEWLLFPRGRVEYVAPPGIEQSGPAFPSVVAVYWRSTKHNTRAEAL